MSVLVLDTLPYFLQLRFFIKIRKEMWNEISLLGHRNPSIGTRLWKMMAEVVLLENMFVGFAVVAIYEGIAQPNWKHLISWRWAVALPLLFLSICIRRWMLFIRIEQEKAGPKESSMPAQDSIQKSVLTAMH